MGAQGRAHWGHGDPGGIEGGEVLVARDRSCMRVNTLKPQLGSSYIQPLAALDSTFATDVILSRCACI